MAGSSSPLAWFTLSVTATRDRSSPKSLAKARRRAVVHPEARESLASARPPRGQCQGRLDQTRSHCHSRNTTVHRRGCTAARPPVSSSPRRSGPLCGCGTRYGPHQPSAGTGPGRSRGGFPPPQATRPPRTVVSSTPSAPHERNVE